MVWILAILILAIATICTSLGLGGGVLYTPVQEIVFHIHHFNAAATTLTLNVAGALTSTVIFAKRGKIYWSIVFWGGPTSLVGSFIASRYLSGYLPQGPLRIALGIFLVVTAAWMALRSKVKRRTAKMRSSLWSIPIFAFTGTASVLLGVGGGSLNIPLMVFLLNVDLRLAMATALPITLLNSFTGSVGYALAGKMNFSHLVVLLPMAFLGGVLGPKLHFGLSEKMIRWGFSSLLVVAGILLVSKGLLGL